MGYLQLGDLCSHPGQPFSNEKYLLLLQTHLLGQPHVTHLGLETIMHFAAKLLHQAWLPWVRRGGDAEAGRAERRAQSAPTFILYLQSQWHHLHLSKKKSFSL